MKPLELLLLTDRHALESIFETDDRLLLVTSIDPNPDGLSQTLAGKHYDGALVDLGIDSRIVIQLCEMLGESAAGLPVVGFLCCVSPRIAPTLEALASMGVRSFIDLHSSQRAIVQAVIAASRGQSVVQLETSSTLGNEALPLLRGASRPSAPASCREQEVLSLLAEGLTREQIAMATSLSLRTVMRTISGLEEKLEAPCSFVLGVKAAKLGLVP
jgi:DNA-binding NarL/FixJ family response regulator